MASELLGLGFLGGLVHSRLFVKPGFQSNQPISDVFSPGGINAIAIGFHGIFFV